LFVRKLLYLIFVGFGIMGSFAHANERPRLPDAQKPPGLKVSALSERSVLICKNSRAISPDCVIKQLPKKVGAASKIMQGNFLPNYRVNWIVVSKDKLNLCSLPTKAGSVICQPLMNNWDRSKVDLAFVTGKFYFSPTPGSDVNVEEFAPRFLRALHKSARTLSVRVEKKILDPVEASQPTNGGIALLMEEEVEDDAGGGEEGGIGDDSGSGEGGGEGEGGDTCTVSPWLVICTSDPPPVVGDPTEPPQDPPQQSEPWYCTYLGIFCPETPELPPPPTPIANEPESPPEETEREIYDRVAGQCREDCSNVLPTPPGNDGWDFYTCYANCMRDNGLYP
jgi:hypothetical protein